MSDYFREPKKVRTRPELEKSCRMLREHNVELKAEIKRLREDQARFRTLSNGKIKDTLTGEVGEPFSRGIDED